MFLFSECLSAFWCVSFERGKVLAIVRIGTSAVLYMPHVGLAAGNPMATKTWLGIERSGMQGDLLLMYVTVRTIKSVLAKSTTDCIQKQFG